MESQDSQRVRTYHFGWWPELVGVLFAGGLIWFLVTFAEGYI